MKVYIHTNLGQKKKMALQEEFEKQGIWLFQRRGFLPLLILLVGMTLYLYSEIYPETFFLRGTVYEFYYEICCLLVGLFGLFIRVYTIGYSAKNTSGRNVKGQIADRLNTSGLYSLIRHPLYLGNFFMWLGPALLTGNFWFVVAFCFFFWVYYERIMFAEEQFLRKKFGTAYLYWARKVPAFVPDFRAYQKPVMPFSWKKVLKQEKNGFFALFLIFSLFDIIGELTNQKYVFNYFFLFTFVVSGLCFLVLTYLKRNTTVLDEENR
ncbi:methyltransferase [Flagellimonas myxillae]|uniref:methyltransferase n=1 Tax=Flagellimonas myxillae TaxID=2942214 RepID=UPI00201F3784|nr:methyltransferase [Muricauda myxillae]MCL6265793.1 lipid A phosphate methyltransferase [Muricauda myxillae]